MLRCKKCVLDERFIGIRFNKEGICNYCTSSKSFDGQNNIRKKYETKFRNLLSGLSGSVYDCLVAYSGGKDSTYTLHLLKNKYNLRILAYSFDNWFQSDRAKDNILAVLKNINIDHITFTPKFESIKKIILASISGKLYSAKALTRASSICTSCISLIRFNGLRLAIEQEIPFLIFGMSPGQAPIVTSVVKTNPLMIKSMQDNLLKPLYDQLGDTVASFFLEQRHFNNIKAFPYIINPLAFEKYEERAILETAKKYGWQKPDDTDANSTNCLLNAFANQVHLEQFGINPYAYEIAELVRIGSMTRIEGLKKLSEKQPIRLITNVKERLGLI